MVLSAGKGADLHQVRTVICQRAALRVAIAFLHRKPGMDEQGLHFLREGVAQRELGNIG